MPNLTIAQIQESIDRADQAEMTGVIASYRYLLDDDNDSSLEKRRLLCLAVAKNPSYVEDFAGFIAMVLAENSEEEHLQLLIEMATQSDISELTLVKIIQNYRNTEFYLQILSKDTLSSDVLLNILLFSEPSDELYLILSDHISINDDIKSELLRRTLDTTSLYIKKFLHQEEVSKEFLLQAFEFISYQESRGDSAIYSTREFIDDFYKHRRDIRLQVLVADICLNRAEEMGAFLEKSKPLEVELKNKILKEINKPDVLLQVINTCSDELSSEDELNIVNNPCLLSEIDILTNLLSSFRSFRARKRILEIIPPESIVSNILPDNLSRELVQLAFERSEALTIYNFIELCKKRVDVHVHVSLSECCIIGLLNRCSIKTEDASKLQYLLSKTTDINLLSILVEHVDTPIEVLIDIINHKLISSAFLSNFHNILCSSGRDVGISLVHRAIKDDVSLEDASSLLHEIIDFTRGESEYIDIFKEVIAVAKNMKEEMQDLGRELLVRAYFAVPKDLEIAAEILTSELLSEYDIYTMVEAKLIAGDIENLSLIVRYCKSLSHKSVVRILSGAETTPMSDELFISMVLKSEEIDSLIAICQIPDCKNSILEAVVEKASELPDREKEAVLVEVFKCNNASNIFLPELTEANVGELPAVYMQALLHPSIKVSPGEPLFNLLNIRATDPKILMTLFSKLLEEPCGIDIYTASLFFEHHNATPEIMVGIIETTHLAISEKDSVSALIAKQHLLKAFYHPNRDKRVLLAIVSSVYVTEEMLIEFLRDVSSFDIEILANILLNPSANPQVLGALLRQYILAPESSIYLNKDLLVGICSHRNTSVDNIDLVVQHLNLLDEEVKLAKIDGWQDILCYLVNNRKELLATTLFGLAKLSRTEENLKAVLYASFVTHVVPDELVQEIIELPNFARLTGAISLVVGILSGLVELSEKKIEVLFDLGIKELIIDSPGVYSSDRDIRYIVDWMLENKKTRLPILMELIKIDELAVLIKCAAHPNCSPELINAMYEKHGLIVSEALLDSEITPKTILLEVVSRTVDLGMLNKIKSHCNADEDVIRLIEEKQEEELVRLREKSLKEIRDREDSSALLSHIGSVALSLEEEEEVARIKASNDSAVIQSLQVARRRNTKF